VRWLNHLSLMPLIQFFAHDAVFTDIVCQMHDNEIWEIYLEEEFKGRIALSQSGSGLKTVMSVLACLILVPLTPVEKAGHFLMG
jgi:putative ATP-dependent endonuclease of OLD family